MLKMVVLDAIVLIFWVKGAYVLKKRIIFVLDNFKRKER